MSFLRQLSFVLFLLGIVGMGLQSQQPAQAATRTAVQSGSWHSTDTWGASVPLPADTVTIPTGITVTIPQGLGVSRSANTTIEGTLDVYSSFMTLEGSITSVTGPFGSLIIESIGRADNFSTVSLNNGTLMIYGAYNNSTTGSITLSSTSGMTIFGSLVGRLDNYNLITIEANSTLTNSQLIRNSGVIANSGTISNGNTFENRCGGQVTGNAVTGNAPQTVTPAVAPGLVNPIHRAHTTDTTPGFSWNSVASAESYRIMVYLEDRSFEYKKRIFNPNYTLRVEEALTVNKYLWRVRTQDNYCFTWSSWSGRNTLFID